MNPNPEVTDFIAALGDSWQAELCVRLRALIREAAPDAAERMQYKKPHFLRNGKYAAVITPAKHHVGFTIFHAGELELSPEEFEGPPERKTVKLGKDAHIDFERLSALLKRALDTL